MSAPTPAEVNLVWDVLVAAAGAHEDEREAFVKVWPECVEYRFIGDFGFGGKVWWTGAGRGENPIHVSCYTEDRTPERAAKLAVINRILTALVGKR